MMVQSDWHDLRTALSLRLGVRPIAFAVKYNASGGAFSGGTHSHGVDIDDALILSERTEWKVGFGFGRIR